MTVSSEVKENSSAGPKSDGLALSIIVPVYREELAIQPFMARILPVVEEIGDYELIFCLDPSADRTEDAIREFARMNNRVRLLVMSRRFGQPAAILAGLLNCAGSAAIVIDVDLQDPPELISALYRKFLEGYDVVSAKRRSREGETWLKRLVAHLGYKVISRIADVRIEKDTGDYKIISRRVIEELRDLPESHGFLRGLVALIGYRQALVEYDRAPRQAGQGKYNRFMGSISIGLNGVFAFSRLPLSLALWAGLAISALSTLIIFFMLYAKIVLQYDYPMGIPTLTILVVFLGGVQLVALGIIGEYIGRIYDEVRHRPKYIIERAYNIDPRDRRGRSEFKGSVAAVGQEQINWTIGK